MSAAATAASAEPLVRVEDVHTYYGKSHILHGVSLKVLPGEVVGLLGRNGVGKSTTLKTIMGLVRPSHGSILLNGNAITGLAPHKLARAGIGYVPEDRQVFPEHTVHDNLLIGAKRGAKGEEFWTTRRIYEFFPTLASMQTRQAGRLSGGEQQMLTIARTLMGNPEILLLDEPSEGLAPLIVQAIGNLIRTLRDMGVTILIAEQNMHFCLGIATHATIVDKGQVVYRATIDELRGNHAIAKRYLAV
jgi:branched-chain amino acid transport system ATP-binding protein